MGQLLRRYWHPIAGSAELHKEPTKAIRLLGEDLVLYRDRSGTLGLVGQACAHRRVNLLYGIPEQKGLRCPYHGWLYDETGRCLEQPAEAPDSTFKERIKIPAYPVQELGGLVFAYLGPQPAPLLPRWDLLVLPNVLRTIGVTVLPCNWLQAMENSLDPVHLEWLHGHYYTYILEKLGLPLGRAQNGLKHHKQIGFDLFEYGIIKRRVVEGRTEDDPEWKSGHPIIFPNMLKQGGGGRYMFQWRTPMDDTHIYHIDYNVFLPPAGCQAPPQDVVPIHEVPMYDEGRRLLTESIISQDYMVWLAQGAIVDRSLEKLAESDRGIILFRRLLRQQMAIVEDGGQPMNVFRDPEKNGSLATTQEANTYMGDARTMLETGDEARIRFGPRVPEIQGLLAGAR
jgi:5,5'-dehydrodivanillate O-demethylase